MVTKAKYTYEDYLNTPEGERYELIDGELILVASPNEEHQIASIELASLMHYHAKAGDLGRVFHAPFDIVFSDSEVVQPDIMFISKERESIRTGANVRGAPDLVVEILSPSSVESRLELQARTVRQVRRHGVLDSGPGSQDGFGDAAEGRGSGTGRGFMSRGIPWRRRRWRGSGWGWGRYSRGRSLLDWGLTGRRVISMIDCDRTND